MYKVRGNCKNLAATSLDLELPDKTVVKPSVYIFEMIKGDMRPGIATKLTQLSNCFAESHSNIAFRTDFKQYSLDVIDNLTEHLSDDQLNILYADIKVRGDKQRSAFENAVLR